MDQANNTQPPDVPIATEGNQNVSQDEFKPVVKNLKRQGKLLDWTFGFIVAILIVCFLSFITFTIDAWKFHAEKSEEYLKAIESLQKENQELKLSAIEKRLSNLESSYKDTGKKQSSFIKCIYLE